MTLTVGTVFSGAEGFGLGLERAGLHVLWRCEVEPFCRELLQRHWPGSVVYGDVRALDGRRVPRVDVLCGGFPCQDVSVAGSRAGLAGERSGLFFEFMRLVAEIAPRWVVIENVPGLLSSNEGRDMGVVLGVLADLGYGWCYRVLDAQYFGVAQQRRRVFIVGCLGDGAGAAQVLLEPESCGGDPPTRPGPPEEPAGAAGGDFGARRVPAVAHCLIAGRKRNGGERQDGTRETLIPTTHRGERAVRRLTPMECERLQGFPDGWTEGFPDATRRRMVGNAVPVPVAAWIGRRIKEVDRTCLPR